MTALLTEAEAALRATEIVLHHRPYGTLLRGDPALIESITAALLAAVRETVETCEAIVSGDNQPERVCCIGTRGDILRKLRALIPPASRGAGR